MLVPRVPGTCNSHPPGFTILSYRLHGLRERDVAGWWKNLQFFSRFLVGWLDDVFWDARQGQLVDPLFFSNLHGLNGFWRFQCLWAPPQSFDKSDLSIQPIGHLESEWTCVSLVLSRKNWPVGHVRWWFRNSRCSGSGSCHTHFEQKHADIQSNFDILLKAWCFTKHLDRSKMFHNEPQLWVKTTGFVYFVVCLDTCIPGEFYWKQDETAKHLGVQNPRNPIQYNRWNIKNSN